MKKLCVLKINFLTSSNFEYWNKETESNKTVDSEKLKRGCTQEVKKQEEEFCSQCVRNKLVDPYGKTDWRKLQKKGSTNMNFEFESCLRKEYDFWEKSMISWGNRQVSKMVDFLILSLMLCPEEKLLLSPTEIRRG